MDLGVPGIKKRWTNSSALHDTIKYKDKETIFAVLPQQHCDDLITLDENGDTLLHSLFKNERLNPDEIAEILSVILDLGLDPNIQNKKGLTVLHSAITRGMKPKFDLLLDQDDMQHVTHSMSRLGARFSQRPTYLSYYRNAVRKTEQRLQNVAIERFNIPVIQKLIERGADVNCSGKVMPPLILALKKGCIEVVKILLNNGANVNCKDPISSETPLHLILEWHYYPKARDEYTRLLLKGGAYVNARDKNKQSALVLAINSGNAVGVQELLEYGADVDDVYVTWAMNAFVCKPDMNLLTQDAKRSIVYSVTKHCIKLTCCLKICLDSTDDMIYEQFYRDCLLEKETLKSTMIDGRTSLHQWILMDPNKRCRYTNKQELRNIVDSPTLQVQFPLYAIVVVAYYREAVTRKSLLELAKDAWLKLTGIGLLDICVEHIFSHMSNADLIDML